MNRLEKVFRDLKKRNEKAFIPYIMAGDGGLHALMERIVFLEKCGATAIEIGIPFSDPVADGPTIQQAGIRALQQGTTLKGVLDTLRDIRPIVAVPLILMTYLNPIYSYGTHKFIEDASKSGVDGLIIPDLPIEEEEMLAPEVERGGIELIRLATLTSSKERIEAISSRGKGFLYAVTVTGITGSRNQFENGVCPYLQKLKEISPIPVLAGFGISSPEQVKEMTRYCDGVVVGSKIVELLHEGRFDEVEALIRESKLAEIS
ncbi:tryptophan synthase subunit alpha [Bacillus massilinigeriensis]|uniref:tryptophan synthase subunit alpha n=1 Tax=Bacillus massilionigeriensis TaxID=1805475 RepID=UPI00096AFF4B|nr:tryptophan synthase subunit alpha [Bacillus massilionigeriensis]